MHYESIYAHIQKKNFLLSDL